VAALLLLGLGFLPYYSLQAAVEPRRWEDARTSIETLVNLAKPTDAIYVDAGALPAWVFYTTDWHHPDLGRLETAARLGTSGGLSFENAPPRGHLVGPEGDALAFQGPWGVEVYGLFTGMQWRWGLGLARRTPDPGWAENEVKRLQATDRAVVWMLFIHDFGSPQSLITALESGGFRRTMLQESPGVRLARYERLTSSTANSTPRMSP
jgi:hypothetical protein